MRQYQFSMANARTQDFHMVFCTAPTLETAQRAVADAYGDAFVIKATPVAEFAPHYFYCEIDASE